MHFKNWLETFNTQETLDDYTWYHGRTVDSELFSYDFVGGEKAIDQEGSGFYFTNNFENAKLYAENKGVVLKCRINYKKLIVKNRTKTNKKVVVNLIDYSPERNDVLSDFAEDLKIARLEAIQSYSNYQFSSDAYQTIEADFYKGYPKNYLQVISRFYDGQITPHEKSLYGDIKHLIVYNPQIIQVIEKIHL